MKNFHKVSRAALPDQMIAAANALLSGKVSGLSPEQAAEKAAALLAQAEQLSTAAQNVVDIRAASMAATGLAEEQQEASVKLMMSLKYLMLGVDASAAEFDAVGFTPPAERRSSITPEIPTGLAASVKDGSVILNWNSPNASGEVRFLIHDWEATTRKWVLIATTTKHTYKIDNIPPGEFHLFQIKALASDGKMSSWSNTAPVYAKR